MSNKKISELAELTTPTTTDVLPVVNAGSTKKAQLGNLPISTATQTALDAKEATANKSTDVVTDQASNTKYPSVKAVYDWVVGLLTGKQDTLVSGTNIKTINSTSLLGSGDISISANPGGSDTQVQYNSAGSFAGSANLTFDGTTLDANKLNVQERVTIEADSTATTQSVAVIESTSTNSGLVLKPNGTGAIMAQVPDGTITGGNARGQYAVDLQTNRGNAIEVASGNYSTIVGGLYNRASGDFSVAGGADNNAIGASSVAFGYVSNATGDQSAVLGGYINTASGTYSSVVAGRQNQATAQGSFVGGGYLNVSSSGNSVVSGGQSNTASTGTHATVVGGSTNTSSGKHSVSGGNGNTTSGEASVSFGSGNIASARFATALGMSSRAYLYNQFSVGAVGSSFGFNGGSSQYSFLVASAQGVLTTGNTTSVTLDGDAGNLIIPYGNNRAWNVTVKWVAVVTSITGTATGVSVGDIITQVNTLGFKRVSGTSSVVGSVNTISTNNDTSMATASMGYTAGGFQELALTFTAPTFTGGGSVTCRVVAKVELTEVAW